MTFPLCEVKDGLQNLAEGVRLRGAIQELCVGGREPAGVLLDDLGGAHVAAGGLGRRVAHDRLWARELGVAARARVSLVDVRPVAVEVPQPGFGVASPQHLRAAPHGAAIRALARAPALVVALLYVCRAGPAAAYLLGLGEWRGAGVEDKVLEGRLGSVPR